MKKIMLLLFVLLLLSFSGCSNKKEELLKQEECRAWAGNLTPRIWNFQTSSIVRGGSYAYTIDGITWEDGTYTAFKIKPLLVKGSNVGENINYYYLQDDVKYEQKVINKDGYVLGYNSFKIKPVFEENIDGAFELVSINILSCEKSN